MNQQQQQAGAEQNPESFEAMMRYGLYGLLFGSNVMATGTELLWHPGSGSRYHRIVDSALAQLGIYGFLAAQIMTGDRLGSGLIGMGTLALLFTVLFQWHWARVVWLIFHIEAEQFSYDDGESLPFFKLLPWGEKWTMTRMVWEPALVITVALFGSLVHLFTGMAALYIGLSGIALCLKACLIFFFSWEHYRDVFDGLGRSVRLVGNDTTSDATQALKKALSGVAKRIPLSLPRAAVQAVQETLPADLQALLSAPEPEVQRA